MSLWPLAAVIVASFALLAVIAHAQRRQLRTPTAHLHGSVPAVSILKPLKGVDEELEANLTSIFRLDYPCFEVLLGVQSPDDPALPVARRVAATHPNVSARVVVDSRRTSFNPKVNNLANILAVARHDVLLVSDSNVRVGPAYLADLVGHLQQPGVELVSSPIRACAGPGLGAALEALQLNTFVMGGVSALASLGRVCVVGKSMLLRRRTLDAIGGLPFLGRYLAEDQVCGEEVARLGGRIALSGQPVENVLGALSVRDFLHRHLRWARIRRWVSPAGYVAEILLNPVAIAAVAAAAAHTLAALGLAAITVVAKAILDWRSAQVAGAPLSLARAIVLVPLKDLLLGAAWAVPFFAHTVSWRGNRFRIGRRSVLSPLAVTSAPAGQLAPAHGGLAPAGVVAPD